MKALLLGDMSPTPKTDPLFEKGDIAALFHDTLSIFEGNDVNFVNLECVLTKSDDAIKKWGPPLKTAPETADTLKKVGINVCGLSNNHFFDYGKKGALDSLSFLEKAGIMHTGFGMDYEDSRKNLVIEKNGEKLCIIAVCEHEYSYALYDRMGSRPYDEYETIEDIRNAKKENDRVVVIYHGGKEHCQYPSPRLMRACRAMVRAGADVVLCQHSHCIGCYEEYQNCHILYGQGNFHFVGFENIVTTEKWDQSLAVKYDTKSNKIEFIPLVKKDLGMEIAKGEVKEKIMSSFEKRNNDLLTGEWQKGWHEFCESVKDGYLEIIKNAHSDDQTERYNNLFGHYLDCEAHTDVWRELFPTYNQTNEK